MSVLRVTLPPLHVPTAIVRRCHGQSSNERDAVLVEAFDSHGSS